MPLPLIAAGVRWAAAAAVERAKDYWSLTTRAELALVENRKEDAIDDYSEAAGLAVVNRDWFALDSSGQQLGLLGELGFRGAIVGEAAAVIGRAEQQLRALLGDHPAGQPEPTHVVVFSGHMIDNPADRGEGKLKPPRFPPSKIQPAAERIRDALDQIGASAGDLGLCGGASGRRPAVCRSMSRARDAGRTASCSSGERIPRSVRNIRRPGSAMAADVHAGKGGPGLHCPRDAGGAGPRPPEKVSVHDRCNRWILYTALSQGLSKTSFVTPWDGAPGDGPGGTESLVALVRRLTGRQPIIIATADL